MRRLLAACALMFAAVSIEAQAPSAEWKTVSTAHFRVHYPAPYEAWTLRAASRLESIFDAVSRETGYTPQTVIDVVVMNPAAQPNGMAWPLLDTPRIVFFTEPPGPDEQIGAYANWIDLLAVHEVTHVVHMVRPSRNPVRRLIEQYVLPAGRITLASPRWVLEGYATVIEGRLTGAGRPSSTVRALILRQWAVNGRLPTYAGLDGDQRFLGMSMAYLMGSAYLEWLEAHHGEQSLRDLWTRLTARQKRSFDSAFAGVFGDSPERLYGKFVAELTASALAANRAAPMREGELWQDTAWRSGDPAVSPDGSRIVLVVREREKPARLVVLSTAPPEKEEKKFQERLDKIRERDPEDVPPVRTKPLDRDPLHEFTAPDGGDFSNPRWMPDGKSILVTHPQPDADGFAHHDLFLWTPETAAWRRVTHLADVRDADPFPDGRTAVAVRSRFGFSQLATVDLATGGVTPLTEPSIDIVYDHPRVSGDGRQTANVAHRAGRWVVEVRRASGEVSTITLNEGDGFAGPEWSGDSIVATVMSGGFAELHRIGLDGSRTPITRTPGGALSAAPSPDGRIFFMSLDPDGFVLRVVDDGIAPSPAPYDDALVPALPPRPRVPPTFEAGTLSAPEPYGFGRQELTILAGANLAPNANASEIGIRFGDVVGRLDTIAVASFGSGAAPRGAAVAAAWRGWPVELSGHLFNAEDDLADRNGVELRAAWDREGPRTLVRLEGGVLGGEPFDLGFGEAAFRTSRIVSAWRLSQEIAIGAESGSFRQLRGLVRATARRAATGLALEYERRSIDDAGTLIELGGLPSTIIPRSAFANRVFEPALPVATMRGSDYHALRVAATVPGIPLTLFYRRHELGEEVAVAGAEIELGSDPLPILRLAGFDATLGVARPVSGDFGRDTNWWLGLRWRP